ncbi:hypothetical protein CDR68_24680 [Salmonella enterica]|nr:hypothetical protein [Salmonella enterica]
MEHNSTPGVEGLIRHLSSNEKAMSKTVFGDAINYATVWVHKESYLPFNIQSGYLITPNGDIYARDAD